MAPPLACREHAPRRFLRAKKHGIEIGGKNAPPFVLGKIDGAAGTGHAGIVDEDGHRAESLFGGIERRPHRGTVAHVGLGRDGFAA